MGSYKPLYVDNALPFKVKFSLSATEIKKLDQINDYQRMIREFVNQENDYVSDVYNIITVLAIFFHFVLALNLQTFIDPMMNFLDESDLKSDFVIIFSNLYTIFDVHNSSLLIPLQNKVKSTPKLDEIIVSGMIFI